MPLIGCIFLPKVATYKWHIYCFLDTCNFFSHFFDKTERNNRLFFDKTERNNWPFFDKTERNNPLQTPLYPLNCLLGILSCSKCCDADVAFAGGTKAGSGGYYYLGVVEKTVEEGP